MDKARLCNSLVCDSGNEQKVNYKVDPGAECKRIAANLSSDCLVGIWTSTFCLTGSKSVHAGKQRL